MRVAIALGVLGGLIATARADVQRSDEELARASWGALLATHVDGRGRVDYGKIDRARFAEVFARLTANSPKKTPSKFRTRNDKLAYWINAYNACVWKGVLDRLPGLASVIDQKDSFFATTKYAIGGESLSLQSIENDIVRKDFADARVHMALNCASASCPELPAEAFVGVKLDAQLDREVKKFVADRRNVEWNATTKTARVSQIFDWYKDDFGGSPQNVIAWINRYRAPAAKLAVDAKLDYIDYDWRLNDMRLTR